VSVVDLDDAVKDGLVRVELPDSNIRRSRRASIHGCDASMTSNLLAAEVEKNRSHETCVLRIQVKDTGSGIPAERINQILEPYSQAKLSDYRKHGGTGEFSKRECQK
jgi:signal transduction histidine kinase